jgi:hypothetical protein
MMLGSLDAMIVSAVDIRWDGNLLVFEKPASDPVGTSARIPTPNFFCKAFQF